MRVFKLLLATVIILGCKSPQNPSKIMNETDKIQETVTKLFVHTDNRDWNSAMAQFAPKVKLDYSSMTGSPVEELRPSEIIVGWKTVLPGFTHTHHQLGNFITESNGNQAHTFCYGTATHYLDNGNGNIWSVVGSYDFELQKIEDHWKITAMTFNYKYQDGNKGLPQTAMDNLKRK